MATQREYKDTFFTYLFSNPEELRSLYGALSGIEVDKNIPIKINTLKEVLYFDIHNDISFIIGDRLVILIEHQSTINPNMPLRLLLYISRLYEQMLEPRTLYSPTRQPIPRPEFYVLYNGTEDYPDEQTLKLSSLFEDTDNINLNKTLLELEVKVFNINKNHNQPKLKQCQTLAMPASGFYMGVSRWNNTLKNPIYRCWPCRQERYIKRNPRKGEKQSYELINQRMDTR